MTSQEIKMMFAYNAWATNRVFESLAGVPDDLYFKDLKSSHGGIHGTLFHIVRAEKNWLARLTGIQEKSELTEQTASSLQALRSAWQDVASRTAKYVEKVTEEKLRSIFEYPASDGRKLVQTYQQALLHLVNHSTYHRGQIASMMRQVGMQPVATDLIMFYRMTAQPSPK